MDRSPRGQGPGHVFAVHSDIRRLACDAWMSAGTAPAPDTPDQDGEAPLAYIAGVPEDAPPEAWLAASAVFLDRAAADLADAAPRHGRRRPLLALPVIGSGETPHARDGGRLIPELYALARKKAAAHGVDVVLVASDGPACAAIQAERIKHGRDPWRALSGRLLREARRLAGLAQDGELVLFVGAGVGVSAGLPLWRDLLWDLAEAAGIPPDLRGALEALNPMDRARIIERRLDSSQGIQEQVVALMERHRRFALGHALLATLPLREVVTSNYDRLYELASEATGRVVSVLPHAPRDPCDQWLLKMHGCVSRPESIVLTREHFLQYAERRAALSGIVQALLVTRHMLFVGFSLDDDHFHRIADAVRRAVRVSHDGAPDRPFGTALGLRRQPLVAELWAQDVAWVPMCEDGEAEHPDAPRQLEIFVDCLVAQASSTAAHLLDPRYEGVLTDAERDLRDALRAFLERARAGRAEAAPAWDQVEALLRRFGYRASRPRA